MQNESKKFQMRELVLGDAITKITDEQELARPKTKFISHK